jgi:hypothetical protein
VTPAVRAVVEYHRAELIAKSLELRDDPRCVSGLAWGVRALDRVLRACDGETDPVALGLVAAPEPAQAGLFDEAAS